MKIERNQLLLVEDDAQLGFVIKDNLTEEGFQVTLCSDGQLAWETFNNSAFDICVFDVMMPKIDGFTLLEKIRANNKNIPILLLTAKSLQEDKMKGFQLGADDYIVKPFNIEELVYRLKVFLKRSNNYHSLQSNFQLGQLLFDYSNLNLISATKTKTLTQKEGDLLYLLCTHQFEMLKRETILKSIWGNDDYFAGRSMDVFISKLRKYLAEDANIEIINYHGIGFKLILKN